LGVGVGVTGGAAGHPVVPKLVKVYSVPPGNVEVEPIILTVLVKIFTAVHLSLRANAPAVYAIENPTLLSLQSNI
jgi:hypothetical protein